MYDEVWVTLPGWSNVLKRRIKGYDELVAALHIAAARDITQNIFLPMPF
jgi:hypothetical protein